MGQDTRRRGRQSRASAGYPALRFGDLERISGVGLTILSPSINHSRLTAQILQNFGISRTGMTVPRLPSYLL